MSCLTYHSYLIICFKELGKLSLSVRQRLLAISEKTAFWIENNSSLVPCSARWPPPDCTSSLASFCSGQPAERLQQAHWPLGPFSHFPLGCHLDGRFYYLFFSWVPFFSILMRPQIQLERTNANFMESWKLNFFLKRDRTLEGGHSLFSQRQWSRVGEGKERGCDSGSCSPCSWHEREVDSSVPAWSDIHLWEAGAIDWKMQGHARD